MSKQCRRDYKHVPQVVSVLVGGVWSDRFGRRWVMLGSLLMGSLVTFGVGLAHSSWLLVLFLSLMGFFLPLFQPASMAMVGDIIPHHRLNYTYSLMRMASNAGIIIGPMIGGLLADRSFFWIFTLDAVSMILFAAVIFLAVPESRPKLNHLAKKTRLHDVLQDRLFLRFSTMWALTSLVNSQLFMVVPAYLHINLSPQHLWIPRCRKCRSRCALANPYNPLHTPHSLSCPYGTGCLVLCLPILDNAFRSFC